MNNQVNYNRKTKIRSGDQIVFCQEVRENAVRALVDPLSRYVHRDLDNNRFYIDEVAVDSAVMEVREEFLRDTLRTIDAGMDPRIPHWEFAWEPYAQALNGHRQTFAEGVAMLGYKKPAPRKPKEIEPNDSVGLTVEEYNARKKQERIEKIMPPVPEEFKSLVGETQNTPSNKSELEKIGALRQAMKQEGKLR